MLNVRDTASAFFKIIYPINIHCIIDVKEKLFYDTFMS